MIANVRRHKYGRRVVSISAAAYYQIKLARQVITKNPRNLANEPLVDRLARIGKQVVLAVHGIHTNEASASASDRGWLSRHHFDRSDCVVDIKQGDGVVCTVHQVLGHHGIDGVLKNCAHIGGVDIHAFEHQPNHVRGNIR